MTRSVTHLVVTDNFAGVERYVTTVARATAELGWHVEVLGGREHEMRRELPPGVGWGAAPSVATAVLALGRRPLPDVLHVHMTNAEIAAALVPRRGVRVATRHFAARRGSSAAARVVGGLAARRLDAEIAISDTVRRAVEDPTIPVLLNPVPDSVVPRSPEQTIVVAQRLEPEKRTVDAVEAFARSGLADEGWRLQIYGSGSEEGRVASAVARHGLETSVTRHGWAADMPAVLARAGIVLATAEMEPFGLVVVEAMAAGAPVVASAAGGHLETIGQVPGAALYPPGDVGACADALRGVATNADREANGTSLKTWVRTTLSVGAHTDRLLAHYREALGR